MRFPTKLSCSTGCMARNAASARFALCAKKKKRGKTPRFASCNPPRSIRPGAPPLRRLSHQRASSWRTTALSPLSFPPVRARNFQFLNLVLLATDSQPSGIYGDHPMILADHKLVQKAIRKDSVLVQLAAAYCHIRSAPGAKNQVFANAWVCPRDTARGCHAEPDRYAARAGPHRRPSHR